MFSYRSGSFQHYFDALRLHLRLVYTVAQSGRTRLCSITSTSAGESLQIGLRQVINRGLSYTSTLRCWSGRDWSNLGYTKWDEKQHPTEHLDFAWWQLKRLTRNYGPRSCETLLMGCVRESRARDSSRRQPETHHEVFWWTRSCESTAQNSQTNQK